MLTNSSVSGKLHVSHVRGGDLWLQNGEVVHAAALSREGEEALVILSSVDGGDFVFDPAVLATKNSVTLRRTALLRQLSVSSDEWKELLAVFPYWDRTLNFTPRWNEQQPVTRSQFRILSMVGRMALSDLVAQSDMAPRDTLELLRPFVQAGLVDSGARV